MIFEDAFTEKQSEIISMFLEVIGDNVDTIYVFIQSDEWSAMETCAFGVKGSILGNLEAGISDKDILYLNLKIYVKNTICLCLKNLGMYIMLLPVHLIQIIDMGKN